MLFNSYAYPAFLLLCVAAYWLLPKAVRPWLLIAAGMVFYALHSIASLALVLVLCTIVFAVLGLPSARSLGLAACLLVLSTLAYFKYGRLLADTVHLPSSWVDIAMPLGISFFTFELIHLLVDQRRNKLDEVSMRDFLAFIFFFPSLLAGPIKRFQQFSASLSASRIRPEYLYWGIGLLVLGYTQKYLLADPLIPFTRTLAHPSALATQTSAAAGLFLYSLRIYFDFAGLSNIAIGSALLFGILLPRNFRSPYLSPNLIDFWGRWHMSLGHWVRDYIYIPLGGSRVGIPRQMINLLISMTVVGIWHGASWNFAVWGLYHGLGLAVCHTWRRIRGKRSAGLLSRILGCIGTFAFVTIGWAFFVTSSFGDSLILLSLIFGLHA